MAGGGVVVLVNAVIVAYRLPVAGGGVIVLVRATPKSNSVDNVRALQGDATVLEDAIKL